MKTIAHLVLSYVGTLTSFLALASLGLIIPSLAQTANLVGRLLNEPVWLFPIVASILFGLNFYPRLPTKGAFAIWIVPGVILLQQTWSWHTTMSRYDSVWDTFFGSACGGSECLNEALFTAPFYTSVAYSLGALVAAIRLRSERVDIKL